MKNYETVIGLEVHVELATKTKIFCACSTAFGGAPNTHTCPVCTGQPGSLPVLNKQVVEYAVAVGLATNCTITQYSKFDRKNYFYPDNPQNYQISQLYLPICRNGSVEIETANGKKNVRIHEIHMEEDAGKLVHDEWEDVSIVDYNRSGVPLIEIVSEPDMRSAEEVIAYLETLRQTIQYLGASDCKLNEGSMRADVNISVREVGAKKFGTRTEMKNINSFKAIAHAIEGERERQIELLEMGRKVVQETRRWDDNKESSHAMRSKEDAQDYRYFPEPDLVPIVVSDEWIAQIKAKQPELRPQKLARYKKEYDIPEYDAKILTESKHMADIFEAATKLCGKPKKVSNWLMVETMRLLKDNDMDADEIKFSPVNLAKLVDLVDAGTINSSVAKEVFEKIFSDDIDPEQYVEENGLKSMNDEGELKATIQAVIDANPQAGHVPVQCRICGALHSCHCSIHTAFHQTVHPRKFHPDGSRDCTADGCNRHISYGFLCTPHIPAAVIANRSCHTCGNCTDPCSQQRSRCYCSDSRKQKAHCDARRTDCKSHDKVSRKTSPVKFPLLRGVCIRRIVSVCTASQSRKSAHHVHTAVHTEARCSCPAECHDVRHSMHGDSRHALQADSLFCQQEQTPAASQKRSAPVLHRKLSCFPAVHSHALGIQAHSLAVLRAEAFLFRAACSLARSAVRPDAA